MSEAPSRVWERLVRPEGAPIGTLVARPFDARSSSNLLAAVDEDGVRHFLVPVSAHDDGLEDVRSRGVQILTKELVLGDGTSGRFIDLKCAVEVDRGLFDLLGVAISTELSTTSGSRVAVERVVSTWRSFWLGEHRHTMTREEQLGLFAELWFLMYWLIPEVGTEQAISSWGGPTKARHDFELPRHSIEVKATLSSVRRAHQVHGLDQLTPPPDGTLFLFSLAAREEKYAKNTLGGLLTVVRGEAELAGCLRSLEQRLGDWSAKVTSGPDEMRLRVTDERLYRVAEGFPRITPESFRERLPLAVTEISYVIDLAAADDFLLADAPGRGVLAAAFAAGNR